MTDGPSGRRTCGDPHRRYVIRGERNTRALRVRRLTIAWLATLRRISDLVTEFIPISEPRRQRLGDGRACLREIDRRVRCTIS